MASIAYIADKKMIEFHRLNGNQTMNFWRLSSQRKFLHFSRGDYLFFLAKGSEHKVTKEKGIVGYGKLDFSKTMTLTQMWNEYTHLNGFQSKEEFKEAVLKLSKSKTIPKSMHSLYLKDVIFFKYPLYLSEIELSISTNLESYIYLDRKGVSATVKILKKAENIGIDAWQVALDEEINQQIFKQDLQNHVLSNIINSVFGELKNTPKVFKHLIESHKNLEFIKGSKIALTNQKSKHLFFAYESKERQKEDNFYQLFGRLIAVIKEISQDDDISHIPYQITIISELEIEVDKIELLKKYDIGYILINQKPAD